MPLVALETAVLTHGLPRPLNVETALRLQDVVAEEGAHAATVGVVDGRVHARLSVEQIRRLGTEAEVHKVGLPDLPVLSASGGSGGTTAAATLHVAARHGIAVFATGGIGGVHRALPGRVSRDESADLYALARHSVCTVCAGAKAILDLEATLERLESLGVTVLGYRTSTFPAFYSRDSGLGLTARIEEPEEAARIFLARRRAGLDGAVLVCVPVPERHDIPHREIEPAIARAVEEASALGIRAAAVTPFLLERVAQVAGRRAVESNLALLEQNARVAARIAVAIEKLSQPAPVIA